MHEALKLVTFYSQLKIIKDAAILYTPICVDVLRPNGLESLTRKASIKILSFIGDEIFFTPIDRRE